MRSRFDEQLAQLNRELTGMGALCEEIIALSTKSLLDRDPVQAARCAPLDGEIDHKERAIESLCLRLLLHQQPVARDLRQISAALKMITDLERIGDQAADIAEIVPCLDEGTNIHEALFREMAQEVIGMVTGSVDAYVGRDLALAQEVIARDDRVDNCFDRVKTALIALIARNPEEGACALDLLMTAKYLERIGDHAVNVAQWVVFSVTGVHKGERL